MKINKNLSIIGILIFLVITSFSLYLLGGSTPTIWVMDHGNLLNETYLVKMCLNGKKLLDVQFGQSGAIAVDLKRNVIWAPEIGDLDKIHYDQILKIDTTGYILDRYQGYRTAVLAVSPNDGSVWVQGDGYVGNESIAKIATNGKLLFRYSLPSTVYTMAIDPRNDNVWVGGNRFLQLISSTGEVLFETADVSFFSNIPHQIDVESDSGNVWYTNGHQRNVIKRSENGNILADIYTDFYNPVALSINQNDKNVWVAYYNQSYEGVVVKMSQTGEILFTLTMIDQPQMIWVSPFDNTVWVGYRGGILKLDNNGSILDRFEGYQSPISIALSYSSDLTTKVKCLLP